MRCSNRHSLDLLPSEFRNSCKQYLDLACTIARGCIGHRRCLVVTPANTIEQLLCSLFRLLVFPRSNNPGELGLDNTLVRLPSDTTAQLQSYRGRRHHHSHNTTQAYAGKELLLAAQTADTA
jgi:hypothetical protein